jgi:RimJ/RimL family protein N-acetyltransferase
MDLRRATMDDALDVLAWRNDPLAVAMSKTSDTVDRAGHLAWFANAVKDPRRVLFIAMEDGRKLGMVRFDRSDDTWLVSINMAPNERGRGYGRAALNEALAMLRASVGQCRLSAEIKDSNAVSLRLFQQCGFVTQEQRDGFQHLTLE